MTHPNFRPYTPFRQDFLLASYIKSFDIGRSELKLLWPCNEERGTRENLSLATRMIEENKEGENCEKRCWMDQQEEDSIFLPLPFCCVCIVIGIVFFPRR